jgi:geranylgeranyl pyrophosphate synthase
MNFKTFVSSETEVVNKALNSFLLETKKELTKINPLLEELFQNFININQDGKRLRALLVKLGYLIAGGTDEIAIIKPMLAVEIFHSSILAHDDIIDQSPLRRGRPTMHHQLGNDHHAISQTIVLADYGFFLANKLISDSNFEANKKNKAAQIFNNTVLDTAVGEIIDVEIPFQKLPVTNKDALNISLFKTARYTFTGPLQLGAVLAGGDEVLLKSLQKYGDNLGIAFQIQDDILGVFGEVEEMGKSNISDLTEGKATLLAAFAFEHSQEKAVLGALYGNPILTNSEADNIRKIFIDSGALDFARETGIEYTSSATSEIKTMEIEDQYQQVLQQLADFLIQRKK